MRQLRHKRATAVAFVAACVLVLQSLLGAWANSAMAATPLLDAFGNPLCITSVDHDGKLPAGDHSKLPDCCAFGCSMVSSLLDAAPDTGLGLLRPLTSDDVRFDLVEAFHVPGPDHHPGNPRAPPLMS